MKTNIGYDENGEIEELFLGCSSKDRKFKSIFLIDVDGYVVASQKSLPDFPCKHFLAKNKKELKSQVVEGGRNYFTDQDKAIESLATNNKAQNQSPGLDWKGWD